MSKKNKINIPEDQKVKCNTIIHSASVAAGGVGTGLAQIPLADNAVITPIQIGMIIALGKVFNQDISKTAAKAILGGATASFAGRGISQVLVGWIPGVGNVINTATAAAVTEAIGWMAVDSFSKDEYKDIIASNPMTAEEMAEKAESEDVKLKEQLKTRVDEFLSGSKNKKDNKDELYQLLGELEKVLLDFPDDEDYLKFHSDLCDL